MEKGPKPKILCVDDEPAVLEGLASVLRRRFEVLVATSGAAGLDLAARNPDLAVVLSDMRMPGMDGAAFLAGCATLAPDATRLLLTGHADVEAAVRAINQGHIFRFLQKPCPSGEVLEAIGAAAEQHRVVTTERVVLEQTLHGAIKVMTDVLAQVQPLAFGRALRIKRHAGALAEAIGLDSRWQVEVAAMLSQLGAVCLPPGLLDAIEAGDALSPEDAALVARMGEFTDRTLGHLPRLEEVRAILAEHGKHPSQYDHALSHRAAAAAKVLRVAADFDRAQAGGLPPARAVGALRARGDLYDPELIEALTVLHGAEDETAVREVSARGLRAGMVLVEDLRTVPGVLLAAKGYQVTDAFLARLGNFRPGQLREPVLVLVGEARLPGKAAAPKGREIDGGNGLHVN